ncbi:MAG: hypothetical protein RIR79_1727 [Pseudomonadota bacterium]|jgi:16S rRNA (guanine527-N7)-methyltransferase
MSALRPLQAELEQGLHALQLPLSATQITTLLDYLDLVQKWNKVYNLTAVRNPAEMLTHHLLDSLAAVSSLQERNPIRVLDVGSGAGLPGIVFAICLPEVTVHCVDTVGKKAAFIQQVAASLRLPNLRGIHARVESLTEPYDVITSRAFASLVDFTTWSRGALAKDGVWMAMKGKYPEEEIRALSSDVQVFHVESLQVPSLDAQRCMIAMRLLH